ncbi:MAG TPA: TolC family protein [Bryobacteraceae bacterium]|nr:TolC family protein [Bryobacteraceae bacterium]
MEEAVQRAIDTYPSVKVSSAAVNAAAAGIRIARTAYLPRLDATAGINRSTRNNTLGLLLPSQIIAPISGPVLGTNDLASAWGSTVGLLASWQPFDFGLRRANVSVAEAAKTRAEATVARTQLDVATLAADSVLTLIAAEQTVIAARAAVTRSNTLIEIVDALVRSELRPGAEASLARAENAAAQAQLIRAETAVLEARAALGALLGIEPARISVSPGRLLADPKATEIPTQLQNHPAAIEQATAVTEARARLRAVERSYVPRFDVQATTYARGSGALRDGRILGGINGLGPNVQNWGIGLTATFPVFELPSWRARRQAESARIEAETGRYEQVITDLTARYNTALASLDGARRIAATTPVEIEAARAAVDQSTARYRSGLGTALDVADAQRRLSQAEIDDALARLGVWRARLAAAVAQGDVSPVVHEASQ